MHLIAVILTKNEERNVADCVASLAWTDEVVVFDAHSNDKTAELAQAAEARVVRHPFEDFAQQRNAALEMIERERAPDLSTTWIFFVDADERGTAALGQEIRQVIHNDEIDGWWVPRLNYVFGRLTRGAGYYPDFQMRLLRAGHGRYENPASEVMVLQGKEDYLSQPLIHYNYETVAQFHHKQRAREAFEAANLHRKGVKLRPYTLLRQPLRHFWWRYITLEGYREGWHGLRLCVLLAYYFGWRYHVRLWQMRRSRQLCD